MKEGLKIKSIKRISIQDLLIMDHERFYIVNKPSGLSSLNDRSNPDLCLDNLAEAYHPGSILCHRLDKFTSGAMIIAKDETAYRYFSIQFQERLVEKHYNAIVAGVHNFQNKEVDFPIYKSSNGSLRIDYAEGKPALTIFNTLEQFKHFTLLDCEPVTGRMHQIRLHLAAIRTSIAGDELYGGKDILLSSFKRNYKYAMHEERPLNQGYMLHARSLTFNIPDQEEPISVEAPFFNNWEVVLKILRKYDK